MNSFAKREIRASHDRESIVVYQAFRPEIAENAISAGRFVAPFSRARMTWIKPSFLWMMQRCGWATKTGQERVLAIRLERGGFDQLLSWAELAHGASRRAPVLVQWDPERDIHGNRLGQRSIQIGLRDEAVDGYVDEWALSIADITPLVHKIDGLRRAHAWPEASGLLPREIPYPVSELIRQRLKFEGSVADEGATGDPSCEPPSPG